MKASAVGIEEDHDVDGRDLSIKGVSAFEVVTPNFINNVAEKFGHASLGRLVTGVAIKSGFVGGLRTNANNCVGIISNRLVLNGRQAGRTNLAPWLACFLTTLVRMAVRE